MDTQNKHILRMILSLISLLISIIIICVILIVKLKYNYSRYGGYASLFDIILRTLLLLMTVSPIISLSITNVLNVFTYKYKIIKIVFAIIGIIMLGINIVYEILALMCGAMCLDSEMGDTAYSVLKMHIMSILPFILSLISTLQTNKIYHKK